MMSRKRFILPIACWCSPHVRPGYKPLSRCRFRTRESFRAPRCSISGKRFSVNSGFIPNSCSAGRAPLTNLSLHFDHMLKQLYVEIDATDAQKAQSAPLVKSAVNDLLPLHAQLQAAHAQAVQGLTQTTVDRAALEAARVAHLQLADQASKRFV